MKLEQIINLLGKVKSQKFIVRRTNFPHKTFKGYVLHTIELYRLEENNPILVFSVEKTILPLIKEHSLDIIEEAFIEKLFETYAV